MLNHKVLKHHDISKEEFENLVGQFKVVDSHKELKKFLIEDAYSRADAKESDGLLFVKSQEAISGYLYYSRKCLADTTFYAELMTYFEEDSSSDELQIEQEVFAYEVEYLCVDFYMQKKGIGTALMTYFLENIFKKDDQSVFVELTAIKSAVKFYEKFNFSTDFEQPDASLTYMLRSD